MKRTDIPHSDVFFSWTGADRAMKDQIVAYLRDHNISCTESDHDCAGDFRQWSREAVSKSTVFLLLYTEDTPKSKYVPVEITAFKELDDCFNRCVPVVTNFDLYAKNLPELAGCESAVILGKDGLTEKQLDLILVKVRSLICNRLFSIYRHATAPTYLRFVSLLQEMRMTAEFEHTKLYISRSVTDESGQTISDASAFCNAQDIIYLYGPAGSGKTCYIDQLRNAADEETLVLALPCRTLLHTGKILEEMYAEFRRYCGNRDYFSIDNFKSLLSEKHLLLVLDGLDEIATTEGKEALFRATQEYYLANAQSTTLFITCRNSEDAEMWKMNGQTPKVLELHALEEDQIKDFGSNLFLLFGAPDKSDGFYIRIHDLAEEIRTNPLLLSQLAIIYNVKTEIPQTVVGIYDAICEIIVDRVHPSTAAPADFDSSIFRKLSSILKGFSAERYCLLSQGKEKTTEQIFKKILRDHGCNPGDAPSLIRYLQDRAIMVGNEFYHKKLLEYFTAVHYYEQCFDDYDELENHDVLRNLFGHYNDPYWSAVLQMFLIKADSRTDAETTGVLYHALLALEITDFTLLFDACQKLLRQKEIAQEALLTDILVRSATGVYPPYGPLFWYVPEYELYGTLLSALAGLQDEPCFTKALALTRDVCWIFGKYHTAESVNSRIDGKALLAKAELSGIRKGLCELFYQGSTDCTDGNDIYPRCFNLAEAASWKEVGQGIYGRMGTAFEDELGLYSHEMLRPFGGEWVGIVSMDYDIVRIEEVLPTRSCSKLRGLFLSPSWYLKMQKLAINDKHLSVIYVPEGTHFRSDSMDARPFAYPGIFVNDNGLMYFGNKMILPDGITKIGAHAFAGCSSLTSITIPECVTEIGYGSFAGCSFLTSIPIPEGVTLIGSCAFNGCGSLTSITIPESVTEIGDYAFYGCSSLASITIPKGVTRIGSETFASCSALTSIILPEGITEIGLCAFAGCSSLDSVTIPDSVIEIGQDAFNNCSSLASISIPDGVTEIHCGAFSDCSALTSITIPEGVTKIERDAFGGCSKLTSITIPEGVTKLGWDAFNSCNALTSITIPDSVTEIGGRAFKDCSSLASITLPNGITRIECDTFAGCSTLTSITIPAGVTEIGDAAFNGCSALTSITIPDSVTKIGFHAFAGCNALTCISNCPIQYHREYLRVSDECVIAYREGRQCGDDVYDQADTVCILVSKCATGIGLFALADYRPLPSIPFSDTLFKIAPNIWAYRRSSLTSIAIPKGVTEIGCSAFSGCLVLTSITIPEGVIEIGAHAFSCCSELTSITIPGSVTKIGQHAFGGCSGLTSITIPKGVTQIKWDTFYGCSTLTSITLPEGIIEIESNVFRDCRSLSSITIPETVTTIGTFAFAGCSKLTSITLPAGISKIEWNVFKGCRSLASITIPDSVSEICRGAFSNCSSLTSFTIPQKVTKIDAHTFNGCSSLTSIFIPKSVRSIGDNAFAGCVGLRQITLSRRFEDDLPRIFPGVDLSKVTIIWH